MAPSLVAPKPHLIHIPLFLAILLLLLGSINPADAQTGVCYGTQGEGLPSPQATVSLFKQKNIQRVRIYNPNPDILQALSGSNIQVMLNVPNTDLQRLAASQSNAATWVRENVLTHPNVAFRYIVVGNEVRPNNKNARYAQFLLQALKNMQAVVLQAGLGGHIKVSTAFDYGVIRKTNPPSAGKFDDKISYFHSPIIRFLADNGAPLMMNVYPYLIYAGNSNIHLDYALFNAPGSTGVTDPDNGLQYQNLFDVMVDAVYSALDRVQAGSVVVVVSETGWPTARGKDTTVENARAYNNNLIRNVKEGTPKKRGREQETYIFAMYDENNRKSPEWGRYWGLYNNFSPKYPINF